MQREVVRKTPGAPKPVGPYSPAVRAGEFVFCSGQIGLDPESGQIVSGGVQSQTQQVLKNVAAVLAASGANAEQIVMSSIFLVDMKDFPAVNDLYSSFVDLAAPPARQTVAVKELPLGALVEISVIAVLS